MKIKKSVIRRMQRINLPKCPVCGSTRITKSDLGIECKRCGYTNGI